MTRCTVSSNFGGLGSVVVNVTSNACFENTTFENNQADEAIVYCDGNCQFVEVDAIENEALTFLHYEKGREETKRTEPLSLDIIKSKFIDNIGKYGGAVHATGPYIYLTSNEFFGNEATFGGALYLTNELSDLNVYDEGSIYAGNIASMRAGAIYLRSEIPCVHFNHTLFAYNSANIGGAVAVIVDDGQETGELTFYESALYHNTAKEDGGALYIPNPISTYIDGTAFVANDAKNGGAIYLGNHKKDSVLGIERSHFENNTAVHDGPVMVSECGFECSVTFEKTNFISNTKGDNDDLSTLFCSKNTSVDLFDEEFANYLPATTCKMIGGICAVVDCDCEQTYCYPSTESPIDFVFLFPFPNVNPYQNRSADEVVAHTHPVGGNSNVKVSFPNKKKASVDITATVGNHSSVLSFSLSSVAVIQADGIIVGLIPDQFVLDWRLIKGSKGFLNAGYNNGNLKKFRPSTEKISEASVFNTFIQGRALQAHIFTVTNETDILFDGEPQNLLHMTPGDFKYNFHLPPLPKAGGNSSIRVCFATNYDLEKSEGGFAFVPEDQPDGVTVEFTMQIAYVVLLDGEFFTLSDDAVSLSAKEICLTFPNYVYSAVIDPVVGALLTTDTSGGGDGDGGTEEGDGDGGSTTTILIVVFTVLAVVIIVIIILAVIVAGIIVAKKKDLANKARRSTVSF
eukprot:TRINITY_DN6806_c0_g1_i1.p1 TRINITY_DN6806_c0_g1~~TRINITY_DN6806_c0_g1_i1.p1  ORF type:complete len:755 (-),score=121.42 TRINITY_DN6806_c0_g1_i1:37-2088(-)